LVGTARRIEAKKSWTEPVTMSCATVGYSGTGKTPGLNASRNCLDELETENEVVIYELRREHERRVAAAEIAHEAWKSACREATGHGQPLPPKPPEADKPGPFRQPRLYTSDATVEALAVLLLARPTGIMLIADELAGWLGNMRRYNDGNDREFWLQAWNGKSRYPIDRKSEPNPITLPYLLIGVIGGIQPDKLAVGFKGAADGLTARFLWSWPDVAPYRPLTDDSEEVDPTIVRMFGRLAGLSKRASAATSCYHPRHRR
jgi:hypothetical protein